MTSADMRANDPERSVGADPRTWFERHGDCLYRFALARVRQADVAEDLVQETLLAAWKARDEFNGQASERTWLTAILKRKAIDWLRRRVREQIRLASSTTDRFADDMFDRRGKWKTVHGRWNRGGSVEPLDREEFWATLYGCMDKLPDRLHEVFTLRYLDEAAYRFNTREVSDTTRFVSTTTQVIGKRITYRQLIGKEAHG